MDETNIFGIRLTSSEGVKPGELLLVDPLAKFEIDPLTNSPFCSDPAGSALVRGIK